MLYLSPPYHVLDGVSFLPDHADPLQFYYLPLAPHLSTVESGGQRIPQLLLLKYGGMASTGSVIGGGFLNFDCNLGIEADRLAELASTLQGAAALHGTPKLAPVPLVDGSVKLMLLGRESPPPEPPRPAGGAPPPAPVGVGGNGFVTKISHAAKPSLYGDNQAAFSVQLDQEGVTILEQALQGEMSPIGVVYSLQYVGLRPAYNVHVSADWNRVQHHVEESFGVNLVFYSSQIDEVVDKLVEDRVIVIEGDVFVAEGEPGDDVIARYEQAMDEVREMVTETFFEPSLEPMERQTGGVEDTFRRTSQLLATGGQGTPFTRREIDLTRIDQKSLNVNMSERTAVLRSIYPQGHLAGIARMIRDEGLDLARFVIAVSVEDDFFTRRKVRVIPRAEFATDAIASINVALTYEGDTRNVILQPTTAEEAVDWQSVLDGGAMRRDVSVSYEVSFTAALGQGRPASVKSGVEVVQGDAIEIAPRGDGLYEIMQVAITAVDFPWALYPTVELDCAYADADHGIELNDHYVLTEQAAGGAWPVFLLDAAKRTIRYRTVMHGADGRDVAGDWIETADAQIRIADPFGQRRELEIVAPAGLFAAGLDRVFVDVSYADPANGVDKQQSFELNAQNAGTQRFVVELVDPQRREVSFKATLVHTDGSVSEVPESTTSQARIIITPNLKGHRSVAVRPEPVDFAGAGLKEILVEAKYEDDTAQLKFADDIRLRTATDSGRFEFDFVDPAKDAFQYRVTHAYANGLSKATEWTSSDDGELVVPVR